MKAMAVNGSPRKGWNTATLLLKALAGARKNGAETDLMHLYSLSYRGGARRCSRRIVQRPMSWGRSSPSLQRPASPPQTL